VRPPKFIIGRTARPSCRVAPVTSTLGLTERAEFSMSLENKSLVRSFVDAINAQDWPRVIGSVASDFTRHSTAAGEPAVRSSKDLVAFLQAEFATFPDATETLLDLVAEGDKVAARHRFRGTQLGPMGSFPPSGKVLDANYIAIYRIENSRIAEAWAEWDNLAGLKQLGHTGEA
jgi:steroid delta-isomerase-like uncharacterized protein